MKEIKLSFPYPSTSRHNLSQDVALSLSMGLVIPLRIVEVLPGDSHRIGTSYSLISNPLVKPLLQSVRMRVCRFWVPRRIYHYDQRANNTDFDPMSVEVRSLLLDHMRVPMSTGFRSMSNFQKSSLFDYLGYADCESNFFVSSEIGEGSYPANSYKISNTLLHFYNAEPYIAYIDICRNYFADSASNLIAFASRPDINTNPATVNIGVCVTPLQQADRYIDQIQNSSGKVTPFSWAGDSTLFFGEHFPNFDRKASDISSGPGSNFSALDLGLAYNGLCIPFNRPDRLSRLFDTKPLVSQNAVVSSSEISIANLSFLAKIQRYFTRRFFGGSRFTDVMYSVFGQKVPHVDSPVLLDVFDTEVGSELVASTVASGAQNPGVLGGYFCSSGNLTTATGRFKRRYSFNEAGYLFDVVYIMPRLFRAAFMSDFLPVKGAVNESKPMIQGNFVPDFNGIGWQQPSFVSQFVAFKITTEQLDVSPVPYDGPIGFCCEPSWQQYRTLPDICRAGMNPLRGNSGQTNFTFSSGQTLEVNSPLFTFNDRMYGGAVKLGPKIADIDTERLGRIWMASMLFTDPNTLNRVFGTNSLTTDNIFAVFRYSHQAKRQVSKRFTLSFN